MMKPTLSFHTLFLLAVFIFWIAGCKTVEDKDLLSQANGITTDTILIGSSLALSGHAKSLGIEYSRGAQLAIDEVNDQGGIHGRFIDLINLDDRYEPTHTIANTQALIQQYQVFCLFNFIGTPTLVSVKEIIEQSQIPTIGLLTGAQSLREADNHYLFHLRDSYYAETEGAVHYYVDILGLKNIGIFYQEDSFGTEVLKGIQIALKKRGLTPIITDTFHRGSTDIEDGLKFIYSQPVEVVMMAGTIPPLAQFIERSHQLGKHPLFSTVSFVGAEAFGRELRTRDSIETKYYRDIMVTQVVPSPYAYEYPAAMDYFQLNTIHHPELPPSYVGLEGFLNAKLLLHVLDKSGADLTREKLINQLRSLNDYDIGIKKMVSYTDRKNQGIKGIYYSSMNETGSFELFHPPAQ